MATLSQTLRGLPQADEQLVRGPGGVLQRGPTLKEATKRAGLVSAPTTPMGAEFLGVDKQVSKMAGTPQQMQASLQTALRTKQFGREATQQEAAAMQKSAEMQKLGGLGDRVSEMVGAELEKLGKPVTPEGTTAQVDLNAELAIIRNDPNSQDAMDAMLRLVESGQNLDNIAKLVPEAATAIGNLAKGLVREPSTIKVAEFLPQLGYDLPTLAGLLEVPEATLQDYTIEQVQNRINELSTQEFTQAQQLQRQAVSPVTGAAERQLAREAGRELSTVGVRASEADMQRLNQAVAQADQVTLFGETRSVGDWLADDEISALIKQIVESPEGSDLRKQVELEAGDFYKFITDNETALKTAATNLDISATKFGGIQSTNKSRYTSVNLSDDAAKIYATALTQPQAREFTADEIPTIAYLNTLVGDAQKKASDALNALAFNNPELAKEVAKLSKEELVKLGIGQPGSNWDKMTSHNERVNAIRVLKDDDVNGILAAAYEDIPSADIAQDYIKQGNALAALGFESGVALTSLDPTALKQQVIDRLGNTVSVTEAAAGTVPEVKKLKFGKPKIDSLNAIDSSIYSTLRSDLLDGSLSAEDINNPQGGVSLLSPDSLLRLRELADKPGAKIDKPSLDAKLAKLREKATAELFAVVGGADRKNTDPALDIDRWAKLLDPEVDDRKVNKAAVRDLITRTAMGEFQSGRYRFQYMDNSLERLKNLGLLTPEHIAEFNKAAEERRRSGFSATGKKYYYGIDAQGNPLPPPPPAEKAPTRTKDGKLLVTMKKGNKTIQVEAGDQSYYERQGWKR
jgi:hypothetical protein